MPIHDWTRVDPGTFHHFHHRWTAALCDALNTGGLPPDYFALAEQVASGPIPDVLTLRLRDRGPQTASGPGGVLLGRAGEGGLRRTGGRGGRVTRDAVVPGTGGLRPGTAGGHLSDGVGGLPRRAQRTADGSALRHQPPRGSVRRGAVKCSS